MFRLLLAFLLALFASASAAAPLEAYGRLPEIEDGAVSPSGQSVALIVTNGERRAIVVQDLATQKVTLRADTGEAKVRDLRWADERRLLITTSKTASPMELENPKGEYRMTYAFDIQTKKASLLLADSGDRGMNIVYGAPVIRLYRGKPAIYLQGVHFINDYGRKALYRVDADTLRSTLVDPGEVDTIDWAVGPDGEPIGQEFYDRRTGRWALKVRFGAGWREVEASDAPYDRPNMMGVGRDGKSVLYAIAAEDGRWVWREARLDDAQSGDVVPAYDGQAPIRDPQTGRLIGHHTLVGDTSRSVFFDPADAAVWQAVAAAFAGQRISLVSWSSDRKKILVRVDSPAEGPAYAIVDVAARSAQWLGGEYQDLTPDDISERKPIRFKAQDGLELSGYLTLPKGRPAKALPLIVHPHGGPASRDTPGFDWWAQAMASRGYAVLQVNFRGSDGLGTRLLEAGYGEWGKKMQTDLSDGVRHLAGEGIVDPKRVCIVGASYGGYAALAGPTLDRGVYRCAVAVSGLSDLRRLVEGEGRVARRYWKRFMGVEKLSDPALAQISPITHAEAADAPILLIHGRDDTVVPMEQSQIMADALRRSGKPHELLIQKGEDHWLSRGETRLEMLKATMAFVEKHNPPQ
ncbi:MAG: alpha/beta hydrolase family protein [Pseudomonadota bacterium]